MKKVFTIGRDSSQCDIVIYDPTDVVSRSHATIRVDGRKFFITDHSTNGTYRNGIKMTPFTEYAVTKEDEISFGNVATLDWSSIPGTGKRSGNWIIYTIIALLVAALGVVFYLYFSGKIIKKDGPKEDLPKIEALVDTTATTPQVEDVKTKTVPVATKKKAATKEDKKETSTVLKSYKDKDDAPEDAI